MNSRSIKSLLVLVAVLLCFFGHSQEVRELYPELGTLVDKSEEGERDFIELRQRCEDLWGRKCAPTQQEADSLMICETSEMLDFEDYYDVLPGGCSWYCGGGMDTLTASSELRPQGRLSYSAKHAHDLSSRTAWIEGVPGHGIGEFLVYHFPPENPRITTITIINGYVRTAKAWRENSRVKRLLMYLNNEPFAMLNLEDSRHEQLFRFEPMGHLDRDILATKPWWAMKFEIVEVYEGEKYDDTAITEIYFDGIDVH